MIWMQLDVGNIKELLLVQKENVELDDSTSADSMNTAGSGGIPGLADGSTSEGIPGNM